MGKLFEDNLPFPLRISPITFIFFTKSNAIKASSAVTVHKSAF